MPGSQNCFLNYHRKPLRNVLRVFDVWSEIQSDSKSYFGFVSGQILRHVRASPRSRNSCVITLPVTVSSGQNVQQSKELDNQFWDLCAQERQLVNCVPINVFLGFDSAIRNPFSLSFDWFFSAFCQWEFYMLVCLVVLPFKKYQWKFVVGGNIV